MIKYNDLITATRAYEDASHILERERLHNEENNNVSEVTGVEYIVSSCSFDEAA